MLIELSTLSSLLADFLHDHWLLKNGEQVHVFEKIRKVHVFEWKCAKFMFFEKIRRRTSGRSIELEFAWFKSWIVILLVAIRVVLSTGEL